MIRMAGMLAIAVLAAGAATAKEPAAASGKAAEKLAGFEETGESVSCLNLRTIRSINALDDWRLLVRTTGGDYYLNTTSGKCTGASRANTRLEYTTSLTQLCRNQIVRVVDNSGGFMMGSCGLGDFERLAPAPDDSGQQES